ncbi:MAG: hypothetical protein V4549_06795 [Bacteroidota bacterium]
MKTTFKLVGLALIILLSACGSSDITVLKRKYNTGYYVSLGNEKFEKNTSNLAILKPHNNIPSTPIQKKETGFDETTTANTQQNDVNYPLTAGNDDKLYISSENKTKNVESVKSTPTQGIELNITPVNDLKLKKGQVSKVNKKINKLKAKAIDDETILLVILSIFPILALIAIYIKDGKKITLNFWVDLLLHLTVIGYIIFALLVVLDIVSLA